MAVEVITYRLALVYQPVSGTLWSLSTKLRRFLFELQYLHIPCSICIHQNTGIGAIMLCLYRISVECTLCCMLISMHMCRIRVESGLLDKKGKVWCIVGECCLLLPLLNLTTLLLLAVTTLITG
jgi:hypothetical protein